MEQKRNLIFFFVTVALTLCIATVISITGNKNPIDYAPYEAENPNTAERVILSGSDELFEILQNVQVLDRFSSELFAFGKIAFREYDNPDQPMGFEIKRTIQEGEQVSITGRYGQSKNSIDVVMKKLNDGQLSISITDSVTKLNIDKHLSSNQPKNQLIGSLPISATGYSIRYLMDRDEFIINTFNDPSNYDKAVSVLRDALGEELFSYQTVIKYGAGDIQYDNGF